MDILVENTASPCVFVLKIHVKSHSAAGSFATQSLVNAIWSFKMGTMSAGLIRFSTFQWVEQGFHKMLQMDFFLPSVDIKLSADSLGLYKLEHIRMLPRNRHIGSKVLWRAQWAEKILAAPIIKRKLLHLKSGLQESQQDLRFYNCTQTSVRSVAWE